jgi:hypothetical protein
LLIVLLQVSGHGAKQGGVVVCITQSCVALLAKKTTHDSGLMVMVYREGLDPTGALVDDRLWLVADGAATILVFEHLLVDFKRDAEESTQA